MGVINDGNLISVSIVTTCYNNFSNFYKTIDSVLNQNYKSIEYIITDDGSKDFNKEEVLKYIDSRNKNSFSIKILQNEENLGTVKNINNAYKNANGKYIINLSANDIFYNENVVADIINRIEEENTNVLVSSRIVYDENQRIKDILPRRTNEHFIKKLDTNIKQYKKFIMNYIYEMCSGSVLCVRNDYVKKMGYYDTSYTLIEDAPFFADTLYKEKITLAADIVSIYYDGSGVSSSVNEKFDKELNRFLTEKCIEHIDVFNIIEKRRVLYRKYRHEINDSDIFKRLILMIKYLPEVIYFRLFN